MVGWWQVALQALWEYLDFLPLFLCLWQTEMQDACPALGLPQRHRLRSWLASPLALLALPPYYGPHLGFHPCPILIWQLPLNFSKEPPSWSPVWLLSSHEKYQKRVGIWKKMRYQNPGEVSSAGALSPGSYPLLSSELLPIHGRRGHASQTLLHGWVSMQHQPSGWLPGIYFTFSQISLSKGECGKV